MVCATVQISMPGTSCAWAFTDKQGIKSTETTKAVLATAVLATAILAIIKSSFKSLHYGKLLEAAGQRQRYHTDTSFGRCGFLLQWIDLSRGTQTNVCKPRQRRMMTWQRAKSGWHNSTAAVNRRRTCRWRCFARITAAP